MLENRQPPTMCFIAELSVQSANGISQKELMIRRRRMSIWDSPASALRSYGFKGLTVPAKVPLTPATSPVSRACDQVKLASKEKPWEIRRFTSTTRPLYHELTTLLPSRRTPTAGFRRGTALVKNGRV